MNKKEKISEKCLKLAKNAPKGMFQITYKECLVNYILNKAIENVRKGKNK